jgi:hypothetical protein
MKPSELRVGNIVDYFTEGSDRWLNNHTLSANDLICLLDGRADKAEGSQLNENWLLMFGFHLHYNAYQKEIQNGFFLRISLEHKNACITNGDEPLYYIPFPEFVHTLQNAWPVLTGEELTINA